MRIAHAMLRQKFALSLMAVMCVSVFFVFGLIYNANAAAKKSVAPTVVNCKNDYKCFTKNLELCKKAKATLVMPVADQFITGNTYLVTYQYEITGKDAKGLCKTTSSSTDARIFLTPTWVEKLMSESAESVNKMSKINEFVDQMKRLYKAENKTLCKGKPKNLVAMLETLRNITLLENFESDADAAAMMSSMDCMSQAGYPARVQTRLNDAGEEIIENVPSRAATQTCKFKPDVVCETTMAYSE